MAKAEWIYAANHETFDPEGIHELDMLSTLVEECNAHLAKQDTSELAVRIQLTGTGITPGWYEAYTSTGDERVPVYSQRCRSNVEGIEQVLHGASVRRGISVGGSRSNPVSAGVFTLTSPSAALISHETRKRQGQTPGRKTPMNKPHISDSEYPD